MPDDDLRLAHEPETDEAAAAVSEPDDLAGAEPRRRPVADWGGDDLFNHVPRRRFARSGVGTHARRPSASPITTHQLRRIAESEPAPAVRGADARGGAEPGPSAPGGGPYAGVGSAVITLHEPEASAPIGRSWSAERSSAARDRRRARRTIDDRVGPRPDRIAALAFVLGLLLVLLAVATADAAVLSHF